MKIIRPASNMDLGVKWNAQMDGTMIVHSFEADGSEALIVLTPSHLEGAFEQMCVLMKDNPSVPEDQKPYYRALLPLLAALRKAKNE